MTRVGVNRALLQMAQQALLEKSAIVPGAMPPGANMPAAGGTPPADPMAAAGAMPPGAGMPAAPAMAGAGMPADPAMAGAAPPGGDVPATMADVAMLIQQAMANPTAGGKGGKKQEQVMLDTKLWIIIEMLTTLFSHMGVPLPPHLVTGQPPDPALLQQAQGELGGASGGMGAPAPSDPAQAAAAPAATGDKQASSIGCGVTLVERAEATAALANSVASLAAMSRRLNTGAA